MHAPDSYEYAVIRLVPRVDRQEFINVGVILFCLKRGFIDARIHLDETRLLALFPEADLETARAHLDAFCRVCCGERHAGPMARLSPRERFHWLTSPRSALVQTSPVHAGLTEEPAATLDRLMQQLVL